MIALIQRVTKAKVSANNKAIADIGKGLCVFLGIKQTDTQADIDFIIRKLGKIEFFQDSGDKFAKTLSEVDGEILVVSQFTLYGSLRKGKKASFTHAMQPDEAKVVYHQFCKQLEQKGFKVATGEFGAYMQVELVNDGPSTFILSSDHLNNL